MWSNKIPGWCRHSSIIIESLDIDEKTIKHLIHIGTVAVHVIFKTNRNVLFLTLSKFYSVANSETGRSGKAFGERHNQQK